MNRFLLVIAIALSHAPVMGQDVPFFNRNTTDPQSIGAINQNFRELADRKDVLSEGSVPKQYQECIGYPLFCVNKYNNLITIGGPITGIANSSSTIVPQATYTQTSLDDCFAGSTITITTQGNSRVMVAHSGTHCNDVAASLNYVTYKIDGITQPSFVFLRAPVNNSCNNGAFTDITDVLSAGSHSFCLVARVNANTGTLLNDANRGNKFWINELK